MKNKVLSLLGTCLLAGLGGCGSLTFYTDASMKKDEVGLKAYYSKPYILVARDGTSKVTSVSVVYLPDLENPVYAKAKSGYGSANLTLAFANGMITSFGQQTDTKIPETLTALGGLDTSIATARKTRAETAALEKQSGDFGRYVDPLKSIASGLRALVEGDKGKVLTDSQQITLKTNANDLDGGESTKAGGLAAAFAEPGATANADGLVKTLGEVNKAVGAIKPATDKLPETDMKIWSKLASLQAALAKVVDELKPKEADPPALSLYEVIMNGGTTTLREVSLGVGGHK